MQDTAVFESHAHKFRRTPLILKNPNTNEVISSIDNWTRPKMLEHWKSGRSAMELARAWFASSTPTTPKEVEALLATHPHTAGMTFSEGYPERVTKLPQRGEGRNHDLMLKGQVNNVAAVVCVEAKVDEPFGDTIEQRLEKGNTSSPNTKVPERVEALLKIVFGLRAQMGQPPWNALRYQLLTGMAGTALQAAEENAPLAVFIAHEFDTPEANPKYVQTNARDYAEFVACFCSIPTDTVTSGKLYGPVSLKQSNRLLHDVEMFIGKAVTATK